MQKKPFKKLLLVNFKLKALAKTSRNYSYMGTPPSTKPASEITAGNFGRGTEGWSHYDWRRV